MTFARRFTQKMLGLLVLVSLCSFVENTKTKTQKDWLWGLDDKWPRKQKPIDLDAFKITRPSFDEIEKTLKKLSKQENDKQLFKDYVKLFDKKFHSPDEFKFRRDLFRQNKKEMEEFNKKSKNCKLGFTNFFDLSAKELREYYLISDKKADEFLAKGEQEKKKKMKKILKSIEKELKEEDRKVLKKMIKNDGFNLDFGDNEFLTKKLKSLHGKKLKRRDLPDYTKKQCAKRVKTLLSKKKKLCNKNRRRRYSNTNHKVGGPPIKLSNGTVLPNYNSYKFQNAAYATRVINKSYYNIKDYPEKINWADKGFVTGIRTQKKCASCYLFAALGALESLWHIFARKHVNYSEIDLSEQEILDCSKPYGNDGCKGGLVSITMEYIIYEGIQKESAYPYTSIESIEDSYVNPKCKGKKNYFDMLEYIFPDTNIMAIIAAVQYGPVAVNMRVEKSMFKYKSGIVDESICNYTSNKPNHAVNIVGYDFTHSIPHFIVKNSWGSNWGENGYFRIKAGLFSKSNKGLCSFAEHHINVMPIIVKEYLY